MPCHATLPDVGGGRAREDALSWCVSRCPGYRLKGWDPLFFFFSIRVETSLLLGTAAPISLVPGLRDYDLCFGGTGTRREDVCLCVVVLTCWL